MNSVSRRPEPEGNSAESRAPQGSTPGSAPAPAKQPSPLVRWLSTPEASVLLVLVALWIYMFLSGGSQFFSAQNRDYVLRAVSLLAIFAIAELAVILTGGIDLSVGSLVAFSGMLLATLMNSALDNKMSVANATLLGIIGVVGACLLLGLLHASLIHFLKLPPFVVTLGSMSMLRSGALLFNNGIPYPVERFPLITYVGNKKLFLAGSDFGVPVATVLLAVIAVVMIGILGFSRIGRRVYSVGSNEEATRLSGVNVFWVRAFVYGTCSVLCGIGGILAAGYGAQGDPRSGNMLELNAISAAVIGGAILTGGRGSVVGTLLGATLLESLTSMINFRLGDPARWQGMVVGGVLLLAVIFNQLRRGDQLRGLLRRFGRA